MNDGHSEAHRTIRKLNTVGFGLVVLLVGGLGGWASTSELAGAVIAPGTVVVESGTKKIQHPSGGVVSDIRVQEGDAVEEGQVVMRLDATVTGRPSAPCRRNSMSCWRARPVSWPSATAPPRFPFLRRCSSGKVSPRWGRP